MKILYNEKLKNIIDSGYKLYLVGGAARDIVINRTPYDYDFVTNAPKTYLDELLEKKIKRIQDYLHIN